MRIPEFIRPGDTIGIAAPSFGAATEPYVTRLEAAIRKLEERGYRIKTVPSVYKSDGLGISTNPKDAADELMQLYLDPEVAAVISVGGGELMCETMSHIDLQALREAEPKWFMGYSDNTNLLLPLATIAGVPGIYGPCATGFGKEWEAPEKDAFSLLEGTNLCLKGYDRFEAPNWDEEETDPLAPYRLDTEKVLTGMIPGNDGLRKAEKEEQIKMSGRLLGGCLDVLELVSGTRFDGVKEFAKEQEGIIWVLEACDLNVMSIRRALWHLREQGWFDTAAGFLIGRPLAAFGQEMMGVDQYNAVTGILGEFGVPIVMDADVGHVKPMMPLIMGAHAEVSVSGNALEVAMSL
ncbi:MAG: LD-carboxypeptidase [Lachnospiraceae bacterium]|nr:LD-carboxypeptidase [Lachnospiraceae bacterium]